MNNFKIIDGLNEIEFTNVGGLEGFEYPEIITNVEDVAKQAGALYVSSKYGRRRLSWQAVILGTNGPANRRDLLKVTVGALKTLQFTTCDNLDLEIPIELVKITAPYSQQRGRFLFEAVSPDWKFNGQSSSTFTTGATVIQGGVDIPADIPMEFESQTTLNTVNYTGNASPNLVFRIDGPGTRFVVTNQTTGASFEVETTLTSSDYIEINTADRTVLLNGSTSAYSVFSGDFWTFAPGSNTITFIPYGGDSNSELTITYRASFIGI